MLMSSFPEECLSSQWFDVEQPNSRLDIVFKQKNIFYFILFDNIIFISR